MNFLPINVFGLLLVADMITYLHLFFNQVFRLNEGADKLLALLALQVANFVLVDHIGDPQLLLSCLQLVLLVNKLLAEDALLVVQVEEYAQILRHLVVLLRLDDSLDLALLRHLLLNFVHFLHLILGGVGKEALLLLAVNLSLEVLLLPQLLFEQRLMMLVQFTSLPQRHLETGRSRLRVCTICCCRLLQHLLLDSLTRFVCWRDIGRV